MPDPNDSMRLAVFASGGGSNFRSILNTIDDGKLDAACVLLVADREGIGAIEKAEREQIPAVVLTPAAYPDANAFADALLGTLDEHNVNFVALAGYLKKVPDQVVEAFKHRILNIHPALLPSFGGKGMYGMRIHEAVLQHGCRVSGATVHLVDAEYDTGPIVLQEPVPVQPDDVPKSLAARILQVEHRIYPEALQLFASGRASVEGKLVKIHDS